jgi:DNA-binding NarL/FixJ family response regulator
MNAEASVARVILVDDHLAVSQQVARLLPGDFEIVTKLEDGAQLTSAVAEYRPDLIVLDITLPGASGIELASQLRQAKCTARVVFLTVHNDPDYVRAAFAVGASGYVDKAGLASDLVPALHAALDGKQFISPSVNLEAA